MAQALPRCQLVPEPGHRVRFLVDGHERLVWHHGEDYPRPYFYPVVGPAGQPLTRMGHPGAPNHDHHQSVWFAHADVGGVNFWANHGEGRIRQVQWYAYEDGEDRCAMAVRLQWDRLGATPATLMYQDLVVILRPLSIAGEYLLELQSTFTPETDELELGQTPFGLLAVRVAKSVSVHFGGGALRSSEGAESETEGFGQYARYWDYSGPVTRATADKASEWNGITYFDHSGNPDAPAHWHVREDGWMGASLSRLRAIKFHKAAPLKARYLLHIHHGAYQATIAQEIARFFEGAPWLSIERSTKKHLAFELTESSSHPSSSHEP